jgi:mono/diheme cytochrome c family protein
MVIQRLNIASTPHSLLATSMGTAAFLLFLMTEPHPMVAQDTGRSHEAAKSSTNVKVVARGKHIVEGVAGCGYCHTPRDKDGNPDHSRWLEGGPVCA